MPPQNKPTDKGSSPFEIVSTSKSKKGSKGIIVALLIFVFLALSVVAGVFLVRQRQQVSEKAVVQPLPNTVTFPKAGKMRIYYHDYTREENYNNMLMQFKNGNQTAESANIPGGSITPPAKMKIFDTNIEVAAGDTYTVTQFYGGNTSQPSLGWLLPSGGKCGAPGHIADAADKIAWATAQANGEPLVSQQCWADWLSNPNDPSAYDFNDFFIILSYVPTTATPTPTVTPTATPTAPGATLTPTPTATGTAAPNSCNGTCGSNSNCASGYVCYNGNCRNPLCTSASNCTCTGSTATPTATAKSSTSTPASTARTTPMPIPDTGANWPSILGIGAGAAAIIIAILLAI